MAGAEGRPRSDRFVLAVDLGTSILKLGLVSLDGQIVWWEQTPVSTALGSGGAAVQDADEWWRIVVSGTHRGLADSRVSGDQVAAVCVTGQWASTVPVDTTGHPVGPCVMWFDSRGERHSRALFGGIVDGYRGRPLATWLQRSGGIPSPSGADPVGHMLYLSRDRPDIARAARWYLEPVDYLSMRFTGIAAASHASMTAAWLTDNRRLDVLAYDKRLVEMAEVDATKLPPLVATGSVVGRVQPSVAAELGISLLTRVVTGVPDLHGAAVGAGCVRDHEPYMAISTTAWVSCQLPRKKTDVLRHMATVPGLTTDRYLLGNNQDTAGRSLEWFRDEMAGSFSRGQRWSFDKLTALAASSPAGAGGVIFTPWLNGERSPVDDQSARGGFHNVSLSTSGADLTRAVLEGVAYNVKWLLDAVENFTGQRLEPIRLVGGGAQSDLWCQIIADVCDHRMDRVAYPLLAGLRGTALMAGMALGEVDRDEVRDLVPVDRTFEPNPANRELYDRLSKELPGLYKGQRGMFHRLNRR